MDWNWPIGQNLEAYAKDKSCYSRCGLFDLILDNMMTIFGSGGHWVTNLSNLTIMSSMMMMIIPDVCR